MEAGKIVISDRFADSTRVYQGTVRSENRALVDALHDLTIGREPDLTLILDMPADVAHARGVARDTAEDRFEEFGADFQKALRTGFLDLARAYPDRCRVVEALRAAEDVARDIAALTDAALA